MKLDTIIQGDSLAVLKTLPAALVDCVVTSPPYWAQRDYLVEGQLGLEPDFHLYLDKLWAIFDEVRRVLKPTGCCFVNLGDTFSGSGGAGGYYAEGGIREGQPKVKAARMQYPTKSLCLIPQRFAIGMVDRGWICRNEIVWYKPVCMPQSAGDRFVVDWEPVYFFVKQGKYYFDQDAVREPHTRLWDETNGGNLSSGKHALHGGIKNISRESPLPNPLGRAKRSVWRVVSEPAGEEHYASYPPELIRPMILAGTSAKGCCPKCGKPWINLMETIRPDTYNPSAKCKNNEGRGGKGISNHRPLTDIFRDALGSKRVSHGWRPTCKCGIEETTPAIVLDPFSGISTTALVAKEEGRHYIGIELNPASIAISNRRLAAWDAGLTRKQFALDKQGQGRLFE